MTGKIRAFITLICATLLSTSIISVTHSQSTAASKVAKTPNTVTLPKNLPHRQYLAHIASELGWVSNKQSNAICSGYFRQPQSLKAVPHPQSLDNEPAIITAKGPSTFNFRGVSVLVKDVVVTQPGRIVEADKAYIYRDAKTNRITRIFLIGHVHLRQNGKLVVSDAGALTLQPQTARLLNSAYHLYGTSSYNKTLKGPFNAWGIATISHHSKNKIDTFSDATYSTCSPTHPSWWLHASKIVINENKQEGSAYSSFIYFYGIPIFYLPIYSFSLNHQRKTGFLTPQFGYNSDSGAQFTTPFYWNMAPNYDMTITPQYYTKRGLTLSDKFRYITYHSRGNLAISYSPEDKEFAKFRQNSLDTYSNPNFFDQDFYAPYLTQLRKQKTQRLYLAVENYTNISPEWSSHININYVNDSYYFENLGSALYSNNLTNQLLNEANLKYDHLHWNFTTLFQGYETLHPINETQNPPLDQYMRLPELSAEGYYANILPHLDFSAESSLTNFSYQSDFNPNKPIGQRLHIRPGLSAPIYFASGYLKPQIYVDATAYKVEHVQAGQESGYSRVLPIADIDGGLYFQRSFKLRHQSYVQTLEPRFNYLYVPYQNQNNLPNFDTVLLPYSFEQLFALNQFSGLDRIQNNSRLGLGLTSRILNAEDGNAILTADIGIAYYAKRHEVCLSSKCNDEGGNLSPLVADLNYYPLPHLAIGSNFAYNTDEKTINNTGLGVNYNYNNHIISFSYNYVHRNPNSIDMDTTNDFNDIYTYSSNELVIAGMWPVYRGWSAIAYWDYDLNDRHSNSILGGLQYNTCCWVLRVVTEQTYTGREVNSDDRLENKFSTGFYFELQLKGLGDFGFPNAANVLKNTIPGFID